MNILQLSPQYPFEESDGGKKSISMFFKGFIEQGHNVTFVYLGDKEFSDYPSLQNGEIIHLHHSTKNTMLRKIRSVFSHTPLYISKHNSPILQEQLLDIIKRKTIDIVHADHTAMAELAIFAAKYLDVPVVLRLHNVEWKIWQRFGDRCSNFSPVRYYIQRQARLLKEKETQLSEQCDLCLAITEKDKQAINSMSEKIRVATIPFGVNHNDFEPDNSYKESNTLLLATTWAWRHNVDGAIWFINKVMPLIREKIPNAKLYLLGKHLPVFFEKYSSEGIEPTGFVPSIEEYYRRCQVFVSPLFVGSGIRIKILEAMSYGLPVVSTIVGAEGIEADESHGLFVSDDAQTQAQTIIDLFLSADNVSVLGNDAYSYVRKKYSAENLMQRVTSLYEELLSTSHHNNNRSLL